ncbi:hypothetical protein ACIPVK_13540 [Paeniglutamicibacter sp. MACA_103]|uniref:hypothetical protein n=1 Tax=Paeniglutamicibacter sp. MACA_103 TaxID=3377337 RepID=UPI003893AE64
MRAQKHLIVTALLVGAGVLLAGCADAGGPGASPGAPSSGQAPTADLQISIRANGTDESAHHHLLCNGPLALEQSEHPRAAAACALLDASPQLLAPPAAGATRMCTQQYGGPAVARVTGTLGPRTVERGFDLRDGCGISDWTAALPLLVDQPTGQLQ